MKRIVLLGGERLPEGQKIVPCCGDCQSGRWVNVETMKCAIDETHTVFDTRTCKVINVGVES